MGKVHYRINCGAAAPFTDADGNVWQADHLVPAPADGEAAPVGPGGWCCVGGKSARREADLPLHPPGLAGLMRTECYAMSAYRLRVPAGRCMLRLVVGETHEGLSSLERRYTLTLNGRPLEYTVQPSVIAAGFGRAGVLEIDGVEAGDEGLEIAFSQNANLYGLEVLASARGAGLSVGSRALAPAVLSDPPAASADVRRPRFLFVGHSGTFFWAIPETLARIIALNHRLLRLEIDAFYAGGKGVEYFLEAPQVREKLGGKFDYVVLQDSSRGPIESPGILARCMPRLIDAVRAAGARPILYAYSGPLRHTADERLLLQDRYDRIGRETDTPVVPCAAALARAMSEDPGQNYHNPDQNHVGMMSGYLFACCWYRALCGQSATGHPEHSTLGGHVHVPPAKARYLADLADRVCLERGIGQAPATAILAGYVAR